MRRWSIFALSPLTLGLTLAMQFNFVYVNFICVGYPMGTRFQVEYELKYGLVYTQKPEKSKVRPVVLIVPSRCRDRRTTEREVLVVNISGH